MGRCEVGTNEFGATTRSDYAAGTAVTAGPR